MSAEPLISFAQNAEDVVLWRALGHIAHGRYVDVGGWDPDVDSVTRLFHDRGWRGIDVEPVPEFAEKFRQRRPHNEVVEAVITDADVDHVMLHRFGATGLSTVDDGLAARHDVAGFDHDDIRVAARRLDDVLAASSFNTGPIHFLKVDVEGAEEQVLRSIDLTRWKPWVLVIEATEPNSTATTHDKWEPMVLAAGYTFTLFDGLSRFYVSSEHPELVSKLNYPACVLDDFAPVAVHDLETEVERLAQEVDHARRDVIQWRSQSVGYWANAVARVQKSDDKAKQARNEADRLLGQLGRAQENLRQARADRKRLRARVGRMTIRIERLEQRQTTRAGARSRLRAAVKNLSSG